MDVVVTTKAARDEILTGEIATGGAFDSGAVDLVLIGADFVPSPDLLEADLVFSDASGIVPVVGITTTGPFVTPEGAQFISGGCIAFLTTDPSPTPFGTHVIYGWAIRTQGGTPVLHAVGKLGTPIILTAPNVSFHLDIEIPYGV